MKKVKELAGKIIKRDGKSNNINNLEKYNVDDKQKSRAILYRLNKHNKDKGTWCYCYMTKALLYYNGS